MFGRPVDHPEKSNRLVKILSIRNDPEEGNALSAERCFGFFPQGGFSYRQGLGVQQGGYTLLPVIEKEDFASKI